MKLFLCFLCSERFKILRFSTNISLKQNTMLSILSSQMFTYFIWHGSPRYSDKLFGFIFSCHGMFWVFYMKNFNCTLFHILHFSIHHRSRASALFQFHVPFVFSTTNLLKFYSFHKESQLSTVWVASSSYVSGEKLSNCAKNITPWKTAQTFLFKKLSE